MNTTTRVFVTTGLVAALLSGCGDPQSRTGVNVEPLTLRPATGGGPGIGNDVMDALAVVTAKGSVHVGDPRAADLNAPGPDKTFELLTTGAADIGVIRSGELVAAGAASLKGLQAPFVVTNNDQAAAVAADPIAEKAMADLAKINLVGLALVPGGLRHPFGYGDKTLLGASDYRAATINTRIDAGVNAMMAALGAQVDHSSDDERTAKIKDGQLRGMETSLHQFGGVDRPAVVTTNVTLYSKFDVILVREAMWTAMSPAQQEELTSAAAAVRVSTPVARGSEEHVFAEWCKEPGAGAARASDAELASLHEALDPVTATLASDQLTKEVIDRMRALHAGTTDPPTDLTCAPDQPSASAWQNLAPVGVQSVLDGTWRFTPTEADLLAAGATASDARNNAGVWEVTLRNGKGTATAGDGNTCEWIFTFAGSRVLFDLREGESCGGMVAGTYKRAGDTVAFTWTETGDPYILKLLNGVFGKAVRVTG